jgi:EAL domain-containing protein (putative c-di-GMP-specific phosphodiesterase class I)
LPKPRSEKARKSGSVRGVERARTFIKDLPRSRADQLTVQAIVQIARGLGKQTVAEFVGDEETMSLLREYGVDFAQGYHIGKPRPARPPAIRASAACV